MNPGSFEEQVLARCVEWQVDVTTAQLSQFARYYALLERWNRRMNLTALLLADYPPKTLDRLFVEPAIGARFLDPANGAWFDLGSGGGSPAIPLKILRPQVTLTMVEAKERKTAFLREVVRQLALPGVHVLGCRIESVPVEVHGTVDHVTVRAVLPDAATLQSIRDLLRVDGRLIAFGWQATSLDGFSQFDESLLPDGTFVRAFFKT